MIEHNSSPWGASALMATVDHIRRRADVTPRLTAVRHGGASVTYRDLADAVDGYEGVIRQDGLSFGSAVVAGLLHCMPTLTATDDRMATAGAMNDVLLWLGRDVDDTGYHGLSTVG